MEQSKVIPTQMYYRIISFVIFLAVNFYPLSAKAVDDTNGGGVLNDKDNCTKIVNPDQRDTDKDNYGNLCDGDLNNDTMTNTLDLNIYKLAHRSNFEDSNYNPHVDFNGDNKGNTLDLNIYKSLHRKPPGPAAESKNLSKSDAAQFLTQTTFGPTLQAIDDLVMLGSYEAWLNEQFALPVALQLPQVRALSTQMCLDHSASPDLTNSSFARRVAWWSTIVEGRDQLRQRVAFALSQIMVISGAAPGVGEFQFGMANYFDILLRNAFGNFRELLEEVTLNPMMRVYLSHIMN